MENIDIQGERIEVIADALEALEIEDEFTMQAIPLRGEVSEPECTVDKSVSRLSL